MTELSAALALPPLTELPAGWSTRRPVAADAPAILAVVHASDIAAVGEPDFSLDDVAEGLSGPYVDASRDSWLALDPAGEIAAWGYLRNSSGGARDFVEVYARPGHGEPAQRPLLAMLLRRVAERAGELGHPVMTARGGAVPTETAWIAALTAAGFGFVKRYNRMRGLLAGVAPTPPPPPPGVRIRAVGTDDAELRRFHAVLEEAFVDSRDHLPTTYEDWRAGLPGINPAEWFVAEVDGEPAGILQSEDPDEQESEGWVKMLAVRRPYRRRGVGEALLRHAFAAYAAHGRTHAGLGVDLTNPTDPVRLYRAVGLEPVYAADMYERPVAAG
ncbi:GNAT family N-acetyltransferase [Spirilliplanes yamanashiensis]|uniref:N-acetyltransferase domain-containing protein n=1 Tax=Spirilliplanes yamanashiensis TaxID=42233 RepID=A0A8J3Y3T3_9ACTN|nr:GNAT family N-acetyltransferase [Spirilliplanes yamanashiensis]MDP9814155.1 ribosomal protein S18 acetylase RimI-like enzyme [Spirilliplanes yamanashiensis]GIJ00863.1 hypothetical protein Sya03_02150 [Spirilliplanes yamanashiensis]